MATLKTNTLTGTSTAGSIAVTGEGNSTTTNLQQGLAKSWVNLDGTATDGGTDLDGVRDSFNVASLIDNSSGNYNVNLTNNTSNTSYCFLGINNTFHSAIGSTVTTSSYNLQSYSSSHSSEDVSLFTSATHGDLA